MAVASGIVPLRMPQAVPADADLAATSSDALATTAPLSSAALPSADLPSAQASAATETAALAAPKSAPAIASNDVVGGTFAKLNVNLKTPVTGRFIKPDALATSRPGTVPADTGEDAAGLTKRVVRTVSIGPDGQPELPEVATAYADPVQPVPVPTPAAVAAAREGDETDIADVSDDPAPAVTKPAPVKAQPKASGSSVTVGRRGANVRSAPSTGSSKVMFALGSGEKVTVIDSQKGWKKITDSRGRSGWVYVDLLVGAG